MLFPIPTPPQELESRVRALLADRCFQCHGPDAHSRQADLRLDLPEDAERVAVPDAHGRSELLERVRSGAMPPPDSGLKLSDDERELLESWVREGANYPAHWAFKPLATPAVPGAGTDPWCRDPLDAFVLADLRAQGLAPAPEASPERWLRRACFDLTGLPPAPSDVDAFLADEAPDAYERVVDRLLGSLAHAECMTARWLDLARYADTYGYQNDVLRAVWPWRDWVLSSEHANQPYDEFVTWQLAGDLLPAATREQRLATTFLRLHRMTNEGGSVEEEFRCEYVADRVQTVGTAVLGLTMECARCHDHKYDPLTQRDFYALGALFANIDECGLYSHFTDAVPTPALDLPGPEDESKLARLEAELAALQAVPAVPAGAAVDLALPLPGRVAFFAMDEGVDAGATLRNEVVPERAGRVGGGVQRVNGRRGGGLRLSGDDPVTFSDIGEFRRWDPFSVGLWLFVDEHKDRAVVVHRSRAWHDAGSRGWQLLLEDGRPSFALVHFWPGDALCVRATEAIPTGRWVHVAATYDGSSRASGAHLYVDGRPAAQEVVRDGLTRKIVGGGERAVTVGERFRDRGLRGDVDELALFDRALAPQEVRCLADGAWAALGAKDRADIARARAVDPEGLLRGAREALAELVDGIPRIPVMEELSEPRTTWLLRRGAYDQPVEPIAPATPTALPPAEGPVRDRLDFARWLFGPASGLTSRVEANRLWSVAFGTGLVTTPEDFGVQGALPSHPALLEYLASELVAGEWDRRALLRRLVLSATYRQDSRVDAALRARDPDGATLCGFAPRRLPAEAIRDAALFASGLLARRVGGPPARPYQPAGLWAEVSGQTYTPDEGEGLWRRSLYTVWKRTVPPPTMLAFDAPSREVCVARRARTATPLQTLALWNDEQFVEAAHALAARVMDAEPDGRGRLALVFRWLLGRHPEPAEVDVLADLFDALRADLAGEAPQQVRMLLAVGGGPDDGAVRTPEERVDLAALALVASTLFTHDAFVTLR